jgi:hypothetical protein
VNLVGALAWYDESPATLDRCLRSLVGVVDVLVALDGRWELHDDGAPALSPAGQTLALEQAAGETMLPTYLYSGPKVWPDQVTKRACLMALASERADWILVIDADEYVAECDTDALRRTLANTTLLVATLKHTSLRTADRDRQVTRRGIRRLFASGTTVSHAHNGYLWEGLWLHGDPAHVQLVQAVDLSGCLHMHHDNLNREGQRALARKVYRKERLREKVDIW